MNIPDKTKIRAVVVDDEQLSRALIKEYLSDHPDVVVVAECSDGFEAVRAVNDLKPDLLFLDIQMPKLDGFEVLELIENEAEILFVTAHDEFALRAFEVRALDYLLKPFSAARFSEALDRARARLNRPAVNFDADAPLRRSAGQMVDRVLIRNGAKVHVIGIDQIDYIQAQDDYVAFMVGGKALLKHQTLESVQQQLDPSRFVRIHRSSILNIDRLARLELYSKDSYQAILQDGTRLAISRSGYSRLQELI